MTNHAEVYICGKCEKQCDMVEHDYGGYEEVWGRPVWVEAWEHVSDCCEDACYTLEEWIENEWSTPGWVKAL